MLFFGTPEFAVASLKTLVRYGFNLAGVVTQPDRPQGRGQSQVTPPPVAQAAQELKLAVLQPEKPSEPAFLERVEAMRPDVFAVAAYGHLLPDRLLSMAPLGAWNVHPSLLPRWRGPAPIHRTIWAGDEITGVSIMKLAARLDAGPLARQETVRVEPRETCGALEQRLAALGADLLVETLQKLRHGAVPLKEQDENAATYAPVFKPEELELNWDHPAVRLDRLIRALAPTPGAHFVFRGSQVKARDAEPAPTLPSPAGTLLERSPQRAWRVACGEGSLWIRMVQPEGKSTMTMDAFIAGRRLKRGDVLEILKFSG